MKIWLHQSWFPPMNTQRRRWGGPCTLILVRDCAEHRCRAGPRSSGKPRRWNCRRHGSAEAGGGGGGGGVPAGLGFVARSMALGVQQWIRHGQPGRATTGASLGSSSPHHPWAGCSSLPLDSAPLLHIVSYPVSFKILDPTMRILRQINGG